MIDNAELSILGGGYYRCTPEWSETRESGKCNQVFAFALPVSGGATYEAPTGIFPVSPGHVYFIPSSHLIRQTCEVEMRAYWVNFASKSYELYQRLLAIGSIHHWPLTSVGWAEPVLRRMPEYDLPPKSNGNHGPVCGDLPASLAIQIKAVAMLLTGMLLEATETGSHRRDQVALGRLQPAIDFMDTHHQRNPSVFEIASQIGLTAAYFHRVFKLETGLTPFRYMENRRLDLAQKFLFDRRLNITQIARKAGYENMAYFTRIFRRRFGRAPTLFRRTL